MNTIELSPPIDVTNLFAPYDIPGPITVQFNQHTYEFDPIPQNNWLFFALKGFEILRQKFLAEGRQVKSFATIGTGSGLDAIGANVIFQPQHLILTDFHPEVISVAAENVQRYIKQGNFEALQGNLCEPLRLRGLQADVIYANLPLIPFSGEQLLDGMNTSSFVSTTNLEIVPRLYNHYLLGIIYSFLLDARSSLKPNGCVVVNLGGRVPIEIIQQLFANCGYSYSELYTGFKLQTQHQEVIPGFSEAEKQLGIEFDFYHYAEAKSLLKVRSNFSTAAELKHYLSPVRVTATQAWELCNQGDQIGHVVQIIRGTRD